MSRMLDYHPRPHLYGNNHNCNAPATTRTTHQSFPSTCTTDATPACTWAAAPAHCQTFRPAQPTYSLRTQSHTPAPVHNATPAHLPRATQRICTSQHQHTDTEQPLHTCTAQHQHTYTEPPRPNTAGIGAARGLKTVDGPCCCRCRAGCCTVTKPPHPPPSTTEKLPH